MNPECEMVRLPVEIENRESSEIQILEGLEDIKLLIPNQKKEKTFKQQSLTKSRIWPSY